jgi:hypothetical protein
VYAAGSLHCMLLTPDLSSCCSAGSACVCRIGSSCADLPERERVEFPRVRRKEERPAHCPPAVRPKHAGIRLHKHYAVLPRGRPALLSSVSQEDAFKRLQVMPAWIKHPQYFTRPSICEEAHSDVHRSLFIVLPCLTW